MTSKFLATQPNIKTEIQSNWFFSLMNLSKQETEESVFTAYGFCQKDSSSVTGLTAFPNSINWNLSEKQTL